MKLAKHVLVKKFDPAPDPEGKFPVYQFVSKDLQSAYIVDHQSAILSGSTSPRYTVEQHEVQEMRAVVGELRPLRECTTAETSLAAFRGAFEGIRVLAEDLGWGHGDINPRNILFYHDKQGEIVGVLHDMDMKNTVSGIYDTKA